jgi:hypothetical protein
MKRKKPNGWVRIAQMWKTFSLRTRLFLPLGLMLVAALLVGAVALQVFAPIQLMDENFEKWIGFLAGTPGAPQLTHRAGP